MELCGEEEMAALVEAIQNDDTGDLDAIDKLLKRYRDDARLHFMRGSILAGCQKHIEAHASLAKAVELAPEFHIARYQLGFFDLTSGEADRALSTWGPLLRLPEEFYLRRLVEGLTHLIRDEFDEAIARLREGITLNTENEPLNNDIRLLIAETEKTVKQGKKPAQGEDGGDQSATSILLGQFSGDSTRQ